MKIQFPNKFAPSKSAIHVRNELFIPAEKESIWFWLTNVKSWPQWYDNSSNIVLLDKSTNKLNKNVAFKWRTFNTNITSTVKEFVPNQTLAWVAKGNGLVAYHSWLIIPQLNGCQVITEETQQGWLPRLFKWFIKKGLLTQHQKWLEGLKGKALLIN